MYLRALQLPAIDQYSVNDLQAVSLPKLETLNIAELSFSPPEIDEWLSKWNLPRLHSVTVSIGHPGNGSQVSGLLRFWKKMGSRVRTLCVQDRLGISKHRPQRHHLPFSNEDKGQNENIPNLQQLILPIWITEAALSGMAVSAVRELGVYWNYAPDFREDSAPDVFILRILSDSTIFKFFPSLQSFHFTYIPNLPSAPGKARIPISKQDQKRLSDLLGYLDTYDDPIRDQGISVGMTTVEGRDLQSTEELREAHRSFQRHQR
jgi:hypothetical protein